MPRGRPRKNPVEPTGQAAAITQAEKETMPEQQDEGTEENPGPDFKNGVKPSDPHPENPLNKWTRNSQGLLENLEYVYNEDGSVNWLKMIPSEHFVAKGRSGEQDTSKLEDKDKLILQSGFKKLAEIRGYTKIESEVLVCTTDHVAIQTFITWSPNFETDYLPRITEGFADAHIGNVSNKRAPNGYYAPNFLITTAENRAFARAVKKALGIQVLAQDEIVPTEEQQGNVAPEPDNSHAYAILQKLLDDNGKIPFEKFANQMTKYVTDGKIKNLDVQSWESLSDIPIERVHEVTKFLQERIEARKRSEG